jgi:RNA-directed DNA polymerase
LRQQYAKLRRRINEDKSTVALAWDRKFLGYRFLVVKDGTVKRGVAANALEELKQRVRQITCRNNGRNLGQVAKELGGFLRGWKEYFKLAETPTILRTLDGWIHRRLRAVALKRWKRGRATLRALRARDVPEWLARKGAGHSGRWWWASTLGAMHTALPGSYFERLGVPRLAPYTSTL